VRDVLHTLEEEEEEEEEEEDKIHRHRSILGEVWQA
jgi:hypothetical protein